MKTTIDLKAMIAKIENDLNVCNNEIEYLTHPELYGCGIYKCNSIVINKERMMTITTDEENRTTYEFSPLYPTYFSPEAAREIVEHDIYKDINGNRLKMEIIGKLEYYRMLKAKSENDLEIIKSLIA